MNYGTIFEVLKTKAVRHRVPQSSWVTLCGKEMKIPETFHHKSGWNTEHSKPVEERCKKCYPNQIAKRKRSWLTKK